ncbi:hypothetical protein RB595_008234 [Gaeumannomyces hyphopodioides]
MCTYYYLHHHHLAPCARPVDIVVSYAYCQDATDVCYPEHATAAAAGGLSNSQQQQQQQQQPCQKLYFDPAQSVLDYSDPCASGGCLASPECASGACRLEDLGGRWMCCACRRRGNRFRWCRHPKRKSPDTFCYHTCCHNCTRDPATGDGDGDGGGDAAAAATSSSSRRR